ncbi:MAG: cytochrome C oxidase subunit IV family protein [Rhodocyclaceae bacterium]|nr:cytochrome C oxidase subunit IV family protein [Rhodocyclaceae bacterium]
MTARKLDIAFAILIVATFITWLIGEWWTAHAVILPVMAGMLALTFVKCRLVILDFMALRPVKSFWRGLVIGWVVVVLGLITLAYLLSLS